MTPWAHAVSSAVKWGGVAEDYAPIHDWLDETKQYTGDWTHRALRHHSAGVQWCIERFGHALKIPGGGRVPIKLIAERHITEDCGFIPTVENWLSAILSEPMPWMLRVKTKSSQPMEIDDAHSTDQ